MPVPSLVRLISLTHASHRLRTLARRPSGAHRGPACGVLPRTLALLGAGLALAPSTALADSAGAAAENGAAQAKGPGTQSAPSYSPPARDDHPRSVFWGDTHLHTRLSQDAYSFGVTLGSDEAYRFAKGETIEATHGQRARLARPLDFLVIADHASGLGSMQALVAGHPKLVASERLRGWRALLQKGGTAAGLKISEDGRLGGWPDELNDPSIIRPAWEQVVEAAEAHNQPGAFTAFIGYEYTSWPGGSNLHRVVVYRDGAKRLLDRLPFSSFHSEDPEDLWGFMNRYEKETGGRVLAIPHNGNLSNGLMFDVQTLADEPLTADYARRRARWEPVTEVTQIKGDGEAHPFLSPDDEFADYETWDVGNFAGVRKTNAMLEHEYARSALKLGVGLYGELGVNPFKFGMIGSTDSHTALSTADEDNFFGKHSAGMEPSAERLKRPVGKSGEILTMGWEQAASGYAAVWARENTRASLWDAIARREVYATTGPRITLRFFGGWDFKRSDAEAGDLAELGYEQGVPMGADLPPRVGKGKPYFLIAAQKDPIGANLDRIQVVKGWRTAEGDLHEFVYDVAWSDAKRRKRNRKGQVAPVGSTVNAEKATYENSIGDAELTVVWQDPNFDPKQPAFYYVRVLEIPTPRWSDYDAAVFGTETPKEVRGLMNQERAYSSPIWYTP